MRHLCPCSATPGRNVQKTHLGASIAPSSWHLRALDYRLGIRVTSYGLFVDAPNMYLPQTSAHRTERVFGWDPDQDNVWRLLTAALGGASRREARECYQVLRQWTRLAIPSFLCGALTSSYSMSHVNPVVSCMTGAILDCVALLWLHRTESHLPGAS